MRQTSDVQRRQKGWRGLRTRLLRIIIITPEPEWIRWSLAIMAFVMELLRLKRFQNKDIGNIYVPPLESTRQEAKFNDKLKVTCFKYCPRNQTIAVGLNNGSIGLFYNERFSERRLTQTKDYESRLYSHVSNPHKGDIRCIIYEKIFDQHYIITGSSDRTIKIWDSDPKTNDVVQTIIGHNGTIMALAYSKVNDSLFSSSNDKTIRIWKQEKHRKYFLHPWYECYQVLSDFSARKVNEISVYVTCFDLKDGQKDKFILYAGDSDGSLHLIKSKEVCEKDIKRKENKIVYVLERSSFGFHRLNINYIHRVAKENILFTLSYDQLVIGYEEATEKQFMKRKNPRKHLFISCVWYNNILILVDDAGYLYTAQINSEVEMEEVYRYSEKILSMTLIKEQDQLLLCTESYIEVIKIKKGIKSGEANCHVDSIIGMFALEPFKVTNRKVKESPKLVTISLDNTMRVWDPSDLGCTLVLENPEKAEISCLHYLSFANLFVTGHENGALRMWNIELGNSITVDQEEHPSRHTNTICALASYEYRRSNEDITIYMFSAGYDGKVVVWEIFEKKNAVQSELMSSTICPQLKNCFYVDETQKSDCVGFEVLALVVYQKGEERFVIAGGNSKKLYFVRMFNYEHLEPIQAHQDSINCLVIDFGILFSGSLDGYIKLWNIDDRTLLTFLKAGEAGIRGLYLVEETGHLVSNAVDGDITYWDYTKKEVVKRVQEKNEKVLCLSYINETQTMYMGTEETNIHSHSIAQLYDKPVLRDSNGVTGSLSVESANFSDQQMEQLIRKNMKELADFEK